MSPTTVKGRKIESLGRKIHKRASTIRNLFYLWDWSNEESWAALKMHTPGSMTVKVETEWRGKWMDSLATDRKEVPSLVLSRQISIQS